MIVTQRLPGERIWEIDRTWTYPQLWLAMKCLLQQQEFENKAMSKTESGESRSGMTLSQFARADRMLRHGA